MFRNPRENANPSTQTSVKPSIGRSPTPPGTSAPRPKPVSTMTSRSSTKPLTPRPTSKSNLPIMGRQSAKKLPVAKTPGKPNASILSFFKKVDSPLNDESIFLSQGSKANSLPPRPRFTSPDISEADAEDSYEIEDGVEHSRFNESIGSVKKRKTSSTGTSGGRNGIIEDMEIHLNQDRSVTEQEVADSGNDCTSASDKPISKPKPKKPRRTGPFLSDSESDDEIENPIIQSNAILVERIELDIIAQEQLDGMATEVETKAGLLNDISESKLIIPDVESVTGLDHKPSRPRKKVPIAKAQAKWEALQPNTCIETTEDSSKSLLEAENSPHSLVPEVPFLKREATSIDEWGKFEDLEDFPEDDEYAEGEEFMERKFMEEQAMLEAAEADGETFNGYDDNPAAGEPPDEEMTTACPICSASLKGIDSDLAMRHVNGCLDGNFVPLPKTGKSEASEVKLMPEGARNRFAQKAAIARPGQANPFDLADANSGPSSAFSKLMSGKAEDAAWASAAAAENASRGKPAYQRTCPFYKIMPGFFICVDAFRYGAVQGCNAYFLSHFHSDHYIGLTSSWCHGPIYCSKVTGNLVKQQLRVDPKYVVSLEFDERFEIPGTQGVAVTMIPANHCPGSSLFLYEKVVGKGSSPKMQRVLHCGDFRACPAHIAHPLLMPDLIDSITGKTKQQKIDVCYLDTTYLNPRYAFPPQEQVVQACADMCVSLKKERAEESDAWETMKRERAGTGMTKFIATATPKPADDSIAMSLSTTSTFIKPRGRLLVVCGTYSIGKERICLGIARALDCKIFAPPGKMRICAALEDPELMSRMTSDPREAQIHMQMLMEIRPETLQEYLNGFKPHFSRVVGFRPSGWNYKPPASRATASPSIPLILNSPSWRSSFSLTDLVPQRGSTREASCFGVPYSEHSSFRELTLFVCALRIEKVVPTVNVGSAASRARMKGWIEKWLAERRKNGVVKIGEGDDEVKW